MPRQTRLERELLELHLVALAVEYRDSTTQRVRRSKTRLRRQTAGNIENVDLRKLRRTYAQRTGCDNKAVSAYTLLTIPNILVPLLRYS